MCMFYFQEETMTSTTREAARFAVTGVLISNTSYNSNDASSFPYCDRRTSIIQVAQQMNADPFHVISSKNASDSRVLYVNPTNPTSSDAMLITTSTNFDGPWSTNCGVGGDYVRIQYKVPYRFITPFMDLLLSVAGAHTNVYMMSNTIIMRNELFDTNSYPKTNAQANTYNYWN